MRSTMRLNPLTALLPPPQHYDSENSVTDSFHDESSNISDNSINSLTSINSLPSVNDENSMNVANTPPCEGKKETVHVKRPMNAFMLWSQIKRREMSGHHPKMKNSEISTQLGKRWKMMTDVERKPFQDQSAKLRAEHMARYPDYKYRPKKKVSKRPKSSGSNARFDQMQVDQNNNNSNNNNTFIQHGNMYYIQNNVVQPRYHSIPPEYTPMDGATRLYAPWAPVQMYLGQPPPSLTFSRKVGEIGSLRAIDGNLAVSPDKNILCGGEQRQYEFNSSSPSLSEPPTRMEREETGDEGGGGSYVYYSHPHHSEEVNSYFVNAYRTEVPYPPHPPPYPEEVSSP
jgi:hypothetical protein